MGYYETAQICVNGHLITSRLNSSPEFSKMYCPECGAKTISTCPACGCPIQGEYTVESVFALGFDFPVPSYCHNCGKPYPWIEKSLKAAEEEIKSNLNLSVQEQADLISELPELISETPRTTLSAKKIGQYLAKFSSDVIMRFVAAAGCEVAKQIIFK